VIGINDLRLLLLNDPFPLGGKANFRIEYAICRRGESPPLKQEEPEELSTKSKDNFIPIFCLILFRR